MGTFAPIYARAVELKGGEAALKKTLPTAKSVRALKALGDDRYLSMAAMCMFRSGFSWRVVEQKWPAFETAFHGFAPGRIVMMDDEALDALTRDASIIRHARKIHSTRDNAAFFVELAREHGSAAAFFANWPANDLVRLWAVLKQRGARLGGNTGPYFLRFVGKDTFLLSRDVVARLIAEGVVAKNPTSKHELAAVQATFNAWHEETGRPYCELSRIAAASVG